MKVKDALEETRQIDAQKPIEIQRGFTLRRPTGGIPVARLHYAAMRTAIRSLTL